jgi:hypothetical protein
MADGGLNTHKQKMIPVFKELDAKCSFIQLLRYYRELCENDKWEEVRVFNRTVRKMGYDPQVFIDKQYDKL